MSVVPWPRLLMTSFNATPWPEMNVVSALRTLRTSAYRVTPNMS
jgi:hypothetical protein